MARRGRTDANQSAPSQEYQPQGSAEQSTNPGPERDYVPSVRLATSRTAVTAGEPNHSPPIPKFCRGCKQERWLCWFKGLIITRGPSHQESDRCVSCRILQNRKQDLRRRDSRETAALGRNAVVSLIKQDFREWVHRLETEGLETDGGIPLPHEVDKEARAIAKKVLQARDRAIQRQTERTPWPTSDGTTTYQEGLHVIEISETDSESEFPVNHGEDHPSGEMPSRSRDPNISRFSALITTPDAEHEQAAQQVDDALANPPLSPRQSIVARGKRPMTEGDENDDQNEHENENNTVVRAKRRRSQSSNYMPASVSEAPVADKTQHAGYATKKEVSGWPNGSAPGLLTPKTDRPVQGEPGSSNNQMRKTINEVSPTRQTGASGSNLEIISPPANNGISDAFLDVDSLVEELNGVVEHLKTIQELRTWSNCAREKIALDVRDFTFAQADRFCAKLSVYTDDVVKETQARLDAIRENKPRQGLKH